MDDERLYEATPDGAMVLAGHDTRELVQQFGTPLIVMLEPRIRSNCRAYCEAMARRYPRSRVYYASKAFLTTGFCRLIEQERLGLDVVSGGELTTALRAGFDPAKILMHGNAKTVEDLSLALKAGVGRIVIDNLEEIARLARLTEELDCRVRVLIRVAPGVKPHTHQKIQTGQVDTKFGFNLSGGAAEEAIRRIKQVSRLDLVGLHCHIGSQIFATQPYAIAARTMMELYARVQREAGVALEELNLGGGLGIRYAPDDCPPSVEEHIDAMTSAVLAAAEDLGVEPPLLLDEPGRSIVGRAGVTLYSVESTKRIPGVRNYAAVDGGMTDNPRYALYEARHHMIAATRMDQPCETLWSISGRCCESGDMLIHDVTLPELAAGDILAVLSTGAYTFSMASNYNRIGRPAVVLVAPGRVGLLAARETSEDLLRLDRIPNWLESESGG